VDLPSQDGMLIKKKDRKHIPKNIIVKFALTM
jgi:hypothetical protein